MQLVLQALPSMLCAPYNSLLCAAQELFSRIRKDLLREMKALKPGDR